MHCGNTHVVDPGKRVESLIAEVEDLQNESAIRRLESEIRVLEQKRREPQLRFLSAGNPRRDELFLRSFLFIVCAVGAIGVIAIGLMSKGSGDKIGALILGVVCVGVVSYVGIHGTTDKNTLAAMYARRDGALHELHEIDRELARKREELDRRAGRAAQTP